MNSIVIIGAGLAGYTLAREFRKLDSQTPVTLVARDAADFYSKPMLSNALAQKKAPEQLVNTPAMKMAQDLGLSVLSRTEVLRIDRDAQLVVTTKGDIHYGRLVLALGADPIRLPLEGDGAGHVLSVNDLEDYGRFRDLLRSTHHIAILGAGLIGCEFANDLAGAGYGVTVIDPGTLPMASLLPEAAARQLVSPLARLGVDWRFGVTATRVDCSGKAFRLTLSDGSQVGADLVLSAVGLRPRIALARESGLTVNRGIVTDATLATSDSRIFALGDCAETGGIIRPYVLPIMQGARVLAQTLAGKATPVVYPFMPVSVKTPAHPVVIQPAPRGAQGEWRELANADGVKMAFYSPDNQMEGFALTGGYAGERTAMTRALSA